MLWRPSEIEVPPDSPFQNDTVGRESHVENIVNLLSNSPEPIVLAIDGEWGSGKTTFLRFLNAVLQTRNHPTVQFNAWEVDFLEDPLVALLAEISDATSRQAGEEGPTGRALANVKKFGGKLLQRGVPILLKAGTGGLVDLASIEGDLADLAEGLSAEGADALRVHIERYEEAKTSLSGFKGALAEFVETIGEDDELQLPLVFFLDELDRCRPDFALATLERIKHAFSVPGVSFVLGLNHSQLAQSIRGAYGASFDGRRYLDRLIDLRYRLPPPNSDTFLRHATEQSGLAEISDLRGAGTELKYIIAALVGLDSTVSSLRIQYKIIAHLNLVLRVTPLQTNVYPPFLALLITLHHIEPDAYHQYVSGKMRGDEIWALLQDRAGGLEFDHHVGGYLRGCLVSASGIAGEKEERLGEIRETLDTWDEKQGFRADPTRKQALRTEERLLNASQKSRPAPRDLELLDERIALARSFRGPLAE